jgi:hypothetical protein
MLKFYCSLAPNPFIEADRDDETRRAMLPQNRCLKTPSL